MAPHEDVTVSDDKKTTGKPSLTSDLHVPTSEIGSFLQNGREEIRRIEKATAVRIAVVNNCVLNGGVPYSVIRSTGTANNICEAETMILKHFFGSKNLVEYACVPEISNHLKNWNKAQLIHFQKEYNVLMYGKYRSNKDKKKKQKSFTLRAWSRADLERSKIKLCQMAGVKENSVKEEEKHGSALKYAVSFEVNAIRSSFRHRDKLEMKENKRVVQIQLADFPSSKTSVKIRSNRNELLLNAVDLCTELLGGKTLRQAKGNPAVNAVKSCGVKKNGSSAGAREKEGAEKERKEEKKDGLPASSSEMNILVLGETGVGKSTFINGLANYLKYGSLEKALYHGAEILIRSSFTLNKEEEKGDGDTGAKKLVPHEIVTEPTICEEGAKERKSRRAEQLKKGQSATQEPRSYVFPVLQDGVDKCVRIIDTPGIGDTRGLQQDRKNFDKILHYIKQFREIHAICILVKPNTSRLTLAFRFCIDELLVHLHRSASRNIVFCFTNTRGTLYKPGDTLPTLKEHLAILKKERGVEIPCDKSTLFSFDNESFRFLCALKAGFPFSNVEKENFTKSWQKSVEETVRLFSRISELPVHCVQETLCLNNTRSVILSLARPLAEIQNKMNIQNRVADAKGKENNRLQKEVADLQKKLYRNVMITRRVPVTYPRTICTSANCVDHKRFSTDLNAKLEPVYKTVCHESCQCVSVELNNCPCVALQQCTVMRASQGNTCSHCGCRWSTHMHIKNNYTETAEKVVDPTVQSLINEKNRSIEANRLFIEDSDKKVAELRESSLLLNGYCAEFAAYLGKNSILPINSSYGEYIDSLIREEKEKPSLCGPSELLKELEKHKQEYEQHIQILKSSLQSQSISDRSLEEIDEMISDLLIRTANGAFGKYVEDLCLLRPPLSDTLSSSDVIALNQESWLDVSQQIDDETMHANW